MGKDVELTYTQGGKPMARFSVAVTRKWNNRDTGEKSEETTWFNVVAFDRLAETCSQYLHKGSKAYLDGRMTSRKYEKDGVTREAWQINLENMELLDAKGASQERTSSAASDDDLPF